MNGKSTTLTGKSEREVFTAALECESAADLQRLLDVECGRGTAMRARVEALLEETSRVDGFLEQPAVRDTSMGEVRGALWRKGMSAGERLGDHIGPYELVDFIGEGGGGSVYLAEQAKPVRRRVALKILKLGMDTKSVIARFEAERQALAMMDHPNIARVLDAGATEEGRPYFVMDHVAGAPLTDYCDANVLGVRERLRVFVEVCRAVEHAHQKGIIHRDLKPSNILVTEQDGVAVPKVIDFGVAKAIDPMSTGSSVVTHVETVIGTPAYMSPEQAERDLDIDTRSDVYSLGVLLHELLTGYTPLDGKKVGQAGIEELRRFLRESKPVRPSVRVQQAPAGDRPMLAHDRDTTIERLVIGLRGDLDWIVLKCLERDRDQRFGSASELAQDLERYLAGEPVMARPPSAAYRFRKFARRHRPAVMVSCTLLLLLVATAAIGIVLAVRATQAEQETARVMNEVVKERERALRSAETARLHEYVADINVSHQALSDGNIARALQLLERHAETEPEETDLKGFEWRFLVGRCLGDEHRSVMRQSSPIQIVEFSPAGDLLAVVSREETVIWDLESSRDVLAVPGEVGAVAFFPDGERVALASRRDGVAVYHLGSPEPVKILEEGGGSLALSADGTLLAAVTGRDVTVWETDSWGVWDYCASAGGPLAFSPDGKLLATGSTGGIGVWSLGTNRPPVTLEGSPRRMFPGGNLVRFAPDGSQVLAPLLSGSASGVFAVGVWDPESGKELGTIPRDPADGGHRGVISKLSVSRDGGLLATSSWDHSVGLWDLATGTMRRVLHGHRSEVWAVALSPDGLRVASGSKDGVVKVWPVNQANPDLAVEGTWKPLAYSEDSQYLAAVDGEGSISIFNLYTQEPVHRIEREDTGRRFPRDELSIAADLAALAEVLPEGKVRVRRLDGDKELIIPVGAERGSSVLLSPDGQTLVTWGGWGRRRFEPGELAWWDLENPDTPIITFQAAQAVFSADGTTLAVVTFDGDAVVFDTRSKAERSRIEREGEASGSRAVLSSDGSLLAVTHGFGDFENAISLWETSTGERVGTLTGHKQGIWSLAFSPDGKTLASSSGDGSLRFWNVASQRELAAISNPGMALTGLMFSPDGQYLVGGSPAFRIPGEMRIFRAPPLDELREAEVLE